MQGEGLAVGGWGVEVKAYDWVVYGEFADGVAVGLEDLADALVVFGDAGEFGAQGGGEYEGVAAVAAVARGGDERAAGDVGVYDGAYEGGRARLVNGEQQD